MIHKSKKYIPLLEDYVETKKITNLDDDVIHDAHVNSFYLEERNPQNKEEKATIFKSDDILMNQYLTSGVSVPGQNILFLLFFSVFFSLAISLTITILLKTQKFINIDTTFPRRVYLNSFHLNNFSYLNQSFNDEFGPINAISNISRISIDDSIFYNINNSDQVYFKNNVYVEEGIEHYLFSLHDNSFKFYQNYGRNLQIIPDVVITGRLKASSISFGPFRIEHNILTNILNPTASQSHLLSSNSNNMVTDFLLKDEYLIVVETNKIFVFFIDQKQIKSTFNPKLIYKKTFYEKGKIIHIDSTPTNNIFTFAFDNKFRNEFSSIKCENKKCTESNAESKNDQFSQEIFDKFGAKIELQETKDKKCQLNLCYDIDGKDCSEIPIQIDSNFTGCGKLKAGVDEDGNSYVVIPEKKLVRIFDNLIDEFEYRDEPLNIPFGAKYQPIQMSSCVIALNDGILEIFSF